MFLHRSALIFLLIASVTPAYAQQPQRQSGGGMVNVSNLPPVKFHQDPLRLQIVDPRPYMTDTRRDDQSPPIYVTIPERPSSSGGVVAIPAGAVPLGNGLYAVPAQTGSSTRSNPMVNTNNLPNAGPQSYVPARPITAGRDLPAGFTTGLHGLVKAPPHAVSGVPAFIQSGRRNTQKHGWSEKPQELAKYNDANVSVGTSSQSRTKTSVHASVVDMTKLLQKQN